MIRYCKDTETQHLALLFVIPQILAVLHRVLWLPGKLVVCALSLMSRDHRLIRFHCHLLHLSCSSPTKGCLLLFLPLRRLHHSQWQCANHRLARKPENTVKNCEDLWNHETKCQVPCFSIFAVSNRMLRVKINFTVDKVQLRTFSSGIKLVLQNFDLWIVKVLLSSHKIFEISGNSSYTNSSYRDYICIMYMEIPPSSSFSSTYRELRVIGIRLIGIRLYYAVIKRYVSAVSCVQNVVLVSEVSEFDLVILDNCLIISLCSCSRKWYHLCYGYS